MTLFCLILFFSQVIQHFKKKARKKKLLLVYLAWQTKTINERLILFLLIISLMKKNVKKNVTNIMFVMQKSRNKISCKIPTLKTRYNKTWIKIKNNWNTIIDLRIKNKKLKYYTKIVYFKLFSFNKCFKNIKLWFNMYLILLFHNNLTPSYTTKWYHKHLI